MCVFPKRCEQPALCVGFLLANVSNWPWEAVHLQTLRSYIHNGPFTCFCVYVCVHKHADVRLRECVYLHVHTYAFLCVSECVSSWWLCASRTAFIRININMCLSCSPSHPCPLVQSVQGRPLSSRSDCQWSWRKVRQARWLPCRGQTVRLIQLKPPVVWRIL